MRISMRSTATAAFAAISLFSLAGASAVAQRPAPARFEMTVDGPVLVSAEGMTLYRYTNEVVGPNGAIRWQCTSDVNRNTNDQQSGIGEHPNIGFRLLRSCLDKFRPLQAPANATAADDFTVVERPDGVRQWAFRGQPLYTSVKDVRAGDRNGLGRGLAGPRRGGMGLVMRDDHLPAGLRYQRRAEGLVLVMGDGAQAVYTPRRNARFLRASIGGNDFRPIAAPMLATAHGDWTIINDDAGQRQYAYRGRPLFAPPVGMNRLQLAELRDWEALVVSPAPPVPNAIGRHLTLSGDVYTNQQGMTLYTYSCSSGGFGGGVICDDAGDPAAFMVALCGDPAECARRWRPYIAERNARATGEFSIVEISYPMFTDMRGALYPAEGNRVRVWAYRGNPLYTYYEDERPGDMQGDRIGGIWGSNFNAVIVPGRSAIDFEP
jgi:predicted lipoprotein with Yx(FWY)xxD motif